MGNVNSSEIDQLKQLYSMNVFQLQALQKELTEQRRLNDQQSRYYQNIINNLQQKQNSIKPKIPANQFNKVDDFLKNIDRDIKASNVNVGTWTPGQSQQRQQGQGQDGSQSYQSYSQTQQGQTYNQYQQAQQGQGQDGRQSYSPTYQSQQGQQRQIPQKNYANVKKSQNEIDPYALYGFQKNQPLNLQVLKEKYKKYALQTHPDVNGGDSRNFNIVNNAYKFLLEEHSKMEKDKQYNELKNNSRSFIESQEKSGMMNRQMADIGSKQNFNLNQFNQVFQENRIEDTSQEGYNSWLKDNQYDSEDIQRDTSVTSGNFNERFNHNVRPSKELQVYKLPQELNSAISSNVQELGVDKVENYSGGNNNIKYTDLKEAHTTSRLVDPNTKYRTYKNIGEVESARANMGDMTDEERRMLENIENNRSREQERREENQRRMDRMFTDHHSKMNQIFLSNRR